MKLKHDSGAIRDELEKMLFPAWKQDIVARARQNGVSGDMLDLFKNLPEQEYGGIGEVFSKLDTKKIFSE